MKSFEEHLAPYDYELPENLIARRPPDARDGGRLLVVEDQALSHHRVQELPDMLRSGDILVVNDTRVMRARLRCRRETGGAVEALFLEPGPGPIRALLRPSKKLRVGEVIRVEEERLELVEKREGGEWVVRCSLTPVEMMERHGEMPLPPYLQRPEETSDRQRYQTVFADQPGAVAAPTASLHLSRAVVERLRERGVSIHKITLHVGIGTFRNLRPEDLESGMLHPEWFSIPKATRRAIQKCREHGGRVIAVGTTVTRTLETATSENERVPKAGQGVTRLFLREGASFRCVDGLMTNFHLPRSSLLMLACAFGGRERILEAYHTAIDQDYRFYSYGDSMLIL